MNELLIERIEVNPIDFFLIFDQIHLNLKNID